MRDYGSLGIAVGTFHLTLPVADDAPFKKLNERLSHLGKAVVAKEHLEKLLETERGQALKLGMDDLIFQDNQEMLRGMDLS